MIHGLAPPPLCPAAFAPGTGTHRQRASEESLLECLARLVPLPARELHTGRMLPNDGAEAPAAAGSSFQTLLIQPGGQRRIVGLHLGSDWHGREAAPIASQAIDRSRHRARLAAVHFAMQQALARHAAGAGRHEHHQRPLRLARLLQQWRLELAARGISGPVIPMLPNDVERARLLGTGVEAGTAALASLVGAGLLQWTGTSRTVLTICSESAWSAFLRGSPPCRLTSAVQAAVTCATRM